MRYIGLGDDSGLCVDALGGAPGIYSARYSGEDANDAKNNEKLLRELKGKTDRRAKFVCCIACVFPNGEKITVQGETCGEILEDASGAGGFGYDPLFYVPELKKTYAEMSAEEKNAISHRGRAIVLLAAWIAYIIMIFTGTANAIYLKLFPDASAYNPLATVLSIVLGYGLSKFIPVMLSFSGLMIGMSLLVLNPVATAKKNLYGKILSPNNIKWLIACYPDNTNVTSFFYSSPERMPKKLNVALSKDASPTPVVIEEFSFYDLNEDDDIDIILQNASDFSTQPEAQATVEITAPEAEEITEAAVVTEEITTDIPEAIENTESIEATEEATAEPIEATEEAAAEPIEATEEAAAEPIEATEEAAAESTDSATVTEDAPAPTEASDELDEKTDAADDTVAAADA